MVSRSAAAPAQHVAARPNQDNDLSQAFVEVPRDDVPAAVAALDGALLGSKRLKARPADKRAAAAPDRSDRSSFAVNQRLAACATGLDVARECAAQTKGGAPLSGVNVATALQRIAKLEARRQGVPRPREGGGAAGPGRGPARAGQHSLGPRQIQAHRGRRA